jgi:hypothetical protein
MKTVLRIVGAILVLVGVFSITGIAFALLMQAPEGVANRLIGGIKLAKVLAAVAACFPIVLGYRYYRRRG